MASGTQILATEFVLAVSVVTYDEIVKNGRIPLPSRYLGAGLAFGVLSIASPFISDKLAATLGAGVVLAVLFNMFPGAPTLNPKTGFAPQGPAAPGGSSNLTPVNPGGLK